MARSLVQLFCRDDSGHYGMMMALAMLPLLLAGGTALDFASISARQAQLQQAMDSAALAIAREGESLSDVEAKMFAKQFLTTNFDPRYADLEIDRNGTKVDIKAAARANLTFGSLLGYENWKVSARSTADLAYTNYEIALVLDTTGSMSGGKLIAMKDAVLGLVNTMSAQVKGKDKLKFAVVPFANFVNVGPHYGPEFLKNGQVKNKTGAKWLDLKGKADFPQVELQKGLSRFELFNHLGEEWAGCVETRYGGGKTAHDVKDSEPNTKDAASLFVPAFSIDEPDEGGYSNNYIDADVDPLDKSAAGKVKKLLKYGVTALAPLDPRLEWLTPDAEISGRRGPNRDCVTQPIMPLNTDFK
ncbi:MAG: pilus assembly protein, partial [Alphaproteobacteria bacterium]